MRIVHAGVGGITESDVGLPPTSGAVVLGFNVHANAQAGRRPSARAWKFAILRVIYDLVDEVKQAISGMLEPTRRETFLGNAEILEVVFTISKVGQQSGRCPRNEGKVERGAQVRLRDNIVVHEGKLSTLEAEVREVTAGQYGMGVRGLPGHAPGRCGSSASKSRALHARFNPRSGGFRPLHFKSKAYDRARQGKPPRNAS